MGRLPPQVLKRVCEILYYSSFKNRFKSFLIQRLPDNPSHMQCQQQKNTILYICAKVKPSVLFEAPTTVHQKVSLIDSLTSHYSCKFLGEMRCCQIYDILKECNSINIDSCVQRCKEFLNEDGEEDLLLFRRRLSFIKSPTECESELKELCNVVEIEENSETIRTYCSEIGLTEDKYTMILTTAALCDDCNSEYDD